MIVSRVVSLVLRIAQFICAAVVLGLTAYFLHQRNSYGAVVPFGRTVYALIWAILSVIAAVIWAIPTTSSMTGYVSDFCKPSQYSILDHHRANINLQSSLLVGQLLLLFSCDGSMPTTADLPGIGMAFHFVAATTVVNGKLLKLSPSSP
jgi:ABC-type sugar transport system permease subunit